MRQSQRPKAAHVGLPYINNLPLIMIVAAVNLAVAFVFHYHRQITAAECVVDAAICGFTTVILNSILTALIVKRMRGRGELPRDVPESRIMQRFPRNVALCALTLAVIFAALMALFSWLVGTFYQIQTLTFERFLVWKLIYSCLLSAKVMELMVLRFIQPDCVRPGDPAQTGTSLVKNPLPSKDVFLNLFHTVVQDFGFNMLAGVALGGTIVVDSNVIITPATRSGIVISGLVLGIIVSLIMVRPAAAQIRAVKLAGELPPLETRCAFVTWIPEKPMLFALTLMLPVMAVSAAVLWAVLTFFGFEALNFFQFFIIRTIYTTLLSKLVVKLAILRYRQPVTSPAQVEAQS